VVVAQANVDQVDLKVGHDAARPRMSATSLFATR